MGILGSVVVFVVVMIIALISWKGMSKVTEVAQNHFDLNKTNNGEKENSKK